VFGFAALVVALGGVAFAAIPDSNGTIHGCYQKQRGNLRVVDSSDECRGNERSLDWNQGGQPGPPARVLGRTTLSDGETRTIFSEGPFTLTASCDLNIPQSTPNFFLDQTKIVVTTTEEHSAVSATNDSEFGPSTPEATRELQGTQEFHFGTQTAIPRYNVNHFSVSAPSGTDLAGLLYASSNAFGHSGTCAFGGNILVGS
jgi:hypothetical protein